MATVEDLIKHLLKLIDENKLSFGSSIGYKVICEAEGTEFKALDLASLDAYFKAEEWMLIVDEVYYPDNR